MMPVHSTQAAHAMQGVSSIVRERGGDSIHSGAMQVSKGGHHVNRSVWEPPVATVLAVVDLAAGEGWFLLNGADTLQGRVQ